MDYDIAESETITVVIPGEAVVSGNSLTATPSLIIRPVESSVTISGDFADGVSEVTLTDLPTSVRVHSVRLMTT